MYSQTISQWLYLDIEKVTSNFELQRLVLYPFSSTSITKLIITTIWLFPELHKIETKHGSLKTAWSILTLYTILPAVGYIMIIKIISFSFPIYDQAVKEVVYSGMPGWVVALIFWSNLEDDRDGSGQDRMLAGSIRLPNKIMPMLALLFFVLLVPDSSLILNLLAAVIACLYVYEKIPKAFLPSDETYTRFEQKSWLSLLTQAPNYVPVNQNGAYLPITNPSSTSALFVNTSNRPNNGATSLNSNFPGQGYRLGSS
ncbi:hypothetical protein G6F46_001865 [Rhizopus delemar]|nr:hypothetical protein G6F55_000547 [Rhizopus delemar]KAG1547651.1 hypothetical protein G6F51_004130 [Rhizopus arrhizus]KAG1496781.1 hypothetical protein G6F54_006234 [Rhizopus delemar]KAG1517267.1 hypothetical protein G6F53_001508 [Rhizopus delemar]KAG1528171.1 hypothetical protein G6F52_000883 [Rhizopus delemar]